MSDELKQFEKLLESQPLRHVPSDWRKEILLAAEKAQTVQSKQPLAGHSLFALFGYHLRSLLWPHPVAWSGLAAIWVLIFAAHFSMLDEVPAVAEKTLPPSPEAVAELKQQKQLLAELMGTSDASAVDRPKIFVPKPRSENTEILAA
jgi:hypothetical protein